MDDAAHASSPDQQREFFEVFRLLRSAWLLLRRLYIRGLLVTLPIFTLAMRQN